MILYQHGEVSLIRRLSVASNPPLRKCPPNVIQLEDIQSPAFFFVCIKQGSIVKTSSPIPTFITDFLVSVIISITSFFKNTESIRGATIRWGSADWVTVSPQLLPPRKCRAWKASRYNRLLLAPHIPSYLPHLHPTGKLVPPNLDRAGSVPLQCIQLKSFQ